MLFNAVKALTYCTSVLECGFDSFSTTYSVLFHSSKLR